MTAGRFFFIWTGVEPDVGGAGGEERLLDVAEQLGAHVVDVRLDEAHAALAGFRLAEPEAENVRPFGRVAAAGAEADALETEGGALEAAEGCEDRGAGRRNELAGRPFAGRHRRPDHREEFERGGRGQRQHAVATLRLTVAQGQGRDVDGIDAEETEAGDGTRYVDHRVDGADLVQLDVVEMLAVDLGLGGAEGAEDAADLLTIRLRQTRASDDFEHFCEGAMARRLGDGYVELRGGEAGAASLGEPRDQRRRWAGRASRSPRAGRRGRGRRRGGRRGSYRRWRREKQSK